MKNAPAVRMRIIEIRDCPVRARRKREGKTFAATASNPVRPAKQRILSRSSEAEIRQLPDSRYPAVPCFSGQRTIFGMVAETRGRRRTDHHSAQFDRRGRTASTTAIRHEGNTARTRAELHWGNHAFQKCHAEAAPSSPELPVIVRTRLVRTASGPGVPRMAASEGNSANTTARRVARSATFSCTGEPPGRGSDRSIVRQWPRQYASGFRGHCPHSQWPRYRFRDGPQ